MSIIFFFLLFVFPGLILSKGQPSEPNNLIGFRTKRSSLSKESWIYANTLAGKLILIYRIFCWLINIIIFIFMIILTLSGEIIKYLFYGQAGLFVLLYIIIYFKVQNNLNKVFDLNGNRRLQ
jgi:uncharacterized membrane protein